MDLSFSQNRFQKLLSQKDIFLKILVACLVLNVLQLIDRMRVQDKVILVPPTLSKEVWVMGGVTSQSFIEEWALYLSSTLLNITSQTGDFHHLAVLRYVHPKSSGLLKKQFQKDLAHFKENNIATVFKPKSVIVTQKGEGGTARISGNLSTFVGSKMIEDIEKTYILEFETSSQMPQLSLISFQEEKHKAPPS